MKRAASFILALGFLAQACRGTSESAQKHLVILATNDIHGGVESSVSRTGERFGGMAILGGIVESIRQGVKTKFGNDGGVLLVDAGDQFQGTLLSNYSEGKLVFDLMNIVGYDAAIPGNHDYDFGPLGWLEDKVTQQTNQNPREVIELLSRRAKFPLVSANTYLKSSIVTTTGNKVEIDSNGCHIKNASGAIDWSKAERPDFLKPYIIKEVAGVRVAIIGIDNSLTPSATTIENVSDLCFRNEEQTYREVRAQIGRDADIFVMLIHNGNSSNEFAISKLLQSLTQGDEPLVDAVIAGHTHFINNVESSGVYAIQSASDGERFGRIDLTWNSESKKVDRSLSKHYAGIKLSYTKCDGDTLEFCGERPNGTPIYEGVPVVPSTAVEEQINHARKEIAPIATRVLGHAHQELKHSRILESPLADLLTDSFRNASHADVAFLNTGGIRANLPAGEVTYEDLFRVLPFSNHALVIGPMKAKQIYALLLRSAQTCGAYGALMQSGLRVVYARNCGTDAIDPDAKIISAMTLSGDPIEPNSDRYFSVATLDFLASGGSGFDGFVGTPVISDLGILREVLTSQLLLAPAEWSGEMDNRWLISK